MSCSHGSSPQIRPTTSPKSLPRTRRPLPTLALSGLPTRPLADPSLGLGSAWASRRQLSCRANQRKRRRRRHRRRHLRASRASTYRPTREPRSPAAVARTRHRHDEQVDCQYTLNIQKGLSQSCAFFLFLSSGGCMFLPHKRPKTLQNTINRAFTSLEVRRSETIHRGLSRLPKKSTSDAAPQKRPPPADRKSVV